MWRLLLRSFLIVFVVLAAAFKGQKQKYFALSDLFEGRGNDLLDATVRRHKQQIRTEQ